jgi:membrane protein YdbS with pleckstrin-like domain
MIDLEEGEYVVAIFRKHWWRIFNWGVGLGSTAVLPLFALTMFLVFVPIDLSTHSVNVFGFFYTVWLTILWIIFFIEWTDYYLDVWIVTNHRVVDIDHMGLFARDVSTVRLEDIEDITTEVHGLLATTLKFGTITVQTAGSRDEFYLHNASDPEKAKHVIYNLIHDAKSEHKEK